MWFAAYLICGLSMEIFVNVLMKFPWVLPDFGIFELADPVHQQVLVTFFGPTSVILNFLVVAIFIYHAFFNHNLALIVEEDLRELNLQRDTRLDRNRLDEQREKEDKARDGI